MPSSTRSLKRSLDRTKILDSMKQHEQKIDNYHQLGEKYKEDKENWEAEYERIENDDTLDRKEKVNQLRILRNEIVKTQQEYEEKVVEMQEEEIEAFQENIEEMQTLAEKLNEQATSLDKLSARESSVDKTAATQEARERAQDAQNWANTNAELLKSKVEHYKAQHQLVANTRLLGD